MDENLTRRERRELEREQEKQVSTFSFQKYKKWVIILLVILGLLGIGFWFYKDSTKPLPGEAVADAGNEHVTDIDEVTYTSNPPTSGKHFAIWAKPGIYDRFISVGYLIHSMEHGYVIIWYDCGKQMTNAKWPMINEVYAHEEPAKDSTDSGKFLMHMNYKPSGKDAWFFPSNPPDEEVPLPDSFKTDSCKSLVSQLSEFTKVAQRVIVVPKMGLDTPIALTAWGRIDKLDRVDKQRIEAFIKAFHNRGPEKTME